MDPSAEDHHDDAPPRNASTTSADDRSPVRVLLVDDDRLARFSTSLALRERGFLVEDCDDGERALERLHGARPEDRPDVLVVDAMMPGIDGFETCRRLRATPELADMPVLMLTALDDEQSIMQALEAGANDFFTKSLRWTLLAARLHFLLRAARTQRELVSSRAQLERAQRIARLGSFEWSMARRELVDLHGCWRVLGLAGANERLSWERLIGMVHPDERAAVMRSAGRSLRSGLPLRLEFRIRAADGTPRVLRVLGEIEREGRRSVRVHGVMQDLTKRRMAEERVRQLANYDALTGLPNRQLFLARCEQALAHAIARGGMIATLSIDVDRFKHVNDTLGHTSGDDLLCEVARRLRGALREEEDLMPRSADDRGAFWPQVARLGGDEFGVLVPSLRHPADADRLAERLLDVLREPLRLGDEEIFPSASIGLAVHPRDGADVATLLGRADVAMNVVKARGGMGVSHGGTAGATTARARLEMERRLARAISRDELVLHYQPQLEIASGRVVGAEALMRWQHDGRLMPPAEFMTLAEETGLIVPMGEWAIRQACAQWRAWADAGVEPPRVAVNIASQHFERESLLDTVNLALAESGMPAGVLELEITETGVMRDLARALPQLEALKRAGVGLAVDDFGTGYSSLAYLTRLPIEVLKIDRSFIRDLDHGDQSAAVVTSIVALARSLSLRVVAEGVETASQCARLAALGCWAGQGWLYAKAMPAADLERWVREARPFLPPSAEEGAA